MGSESLIGIMGADHGVNDHGNHGVRVHDRPGFPETPTTAAAIKDSDPLIGSTAAAIKDSDPMIGDQGL